MSHLRKPDHITFLIAYFLIVALMIITAFLAANPHGDLLFGLSILAFIFMSAALIFDLGEDE